MEAGLTLVCLIEGHDKKRQDVTWVIGTSPVFVHPVYK